MALVKNVTIIPVASQAPQFDPSAPFQVDGGTGAPAGSGAQAQAQAQAAAPAPAQTAPPQFDPSKPFDVAPPIGTGEAAMAGLGQGITFGFGDELTGAMKALGSLGAATPGLDPEIAKAVQDEQGKGFVPLYTEGRDASRAYNKSAHEQHPAAFMLGEVGGALATLPFGGEIQAFRALPAAGKIANTAARVGNSALTGAGFGGLYGAGTGEGAADTALQTGIGAGLGAVGGAVAPAVLEGISGLGRALAYPFRGGINPAKEAQRQVVTAIEANTGKGSVPAVAGAMERAQANGVPLIPADLGGQYTHALADAAAIKSVKARDAITGATEPRFATQNERTTRVVQDIVGGHPDAGLTREQLEQNARRANRPAYKAAYRSGSDGLWSPELERLASSPDVVAAMKSAASTGKTRAVADGYGGFNPGVTVTQDGRVVFNRGPTGVPTYPDLQFWDYTYRALRDAGAEAARTGRTSEGQAITSVAATLRDELDRMVPQFKTARAGAASYFKAENALEAGENFVGKQFENAAARRAVDKMSPAEQQMFAEGFASKLIQAIREVPERADVVKRQIFSSPAARERIEIALGPQGARRLEAHLMLESLMERTRNVVSGNSKTAQRLFDAGVIGVGAGYDFSSGNPMDLGTAAIAGALLKTGRREIAARVATQIGKLLASGTPDDLRKAAQIVSSSPRLLDVVRRADDLFSRTVAAVASPQALSHARADDQQRR